MKLKHVALFAIFVAQIYHTRGQNGPELIPFQGHLAQPNPSGAYDAVPSARYDLLFTLYTAPVGGESKIWGPERHEDLVVVNGLVNALLGSVNGFEDALAADPNFFARPLYVGITIDADGNPATADLELSPRQVLLPSVFAHNSGQLDGADWRRFFVGTDEWATFTEGETKARDADLLDGADWSAFFTGGDPRSGTISGDRLTPNTVGANHLAPDAVGADSLAAGAVTTETIQDGTIQAGDIATGTLDADQVAEGSILRGPYILKSSQYVGLWHNVSGELVVDFEDRNLTPELIPSHARGAIIKVIVNGLNAGSGSAFFADEDGEFNTDFIHYRHNGVTSYSTWAGGPVYVPFHSGKKITLRTDSNRAGDTDTGVRSYGTLIGWY